MSQNPRELFFSYQQTDSKAYMEMQKIQNSQHNTEEEQSKNMTLSDFKIDYEAKVINTIWYW